MGKTVAKLKILKSADLQNKFRASIPYSLFPIKRVYQPEE